MERLQRVYGLDLARSFAVMSAIVGHSITAYNSGEHMYNQWVQFVFRSAAPNFIIIFGVFLELIYAADLKTRGLPYITKRLFSRAVQCYFLYIFSCFVITLSQDYSLKYFLRMVLLAGATPYTDILRFYAAMLLLSPFMLQIKQNYGLKPLVIFCLIVHLVHYIYYPIPYYQGFAGADVVFGLLYGATTVLAGPSVIHGITLVLTGMWIGQHIRDNIDRHCILDIKHPQVLILWLFCMLGMYFIAKTLDEGLIVGLAGMKYRNSNSYVFFMFAISIAVFTIDVSMRVAHLLGAKRIKPVLFLGGTSLFVFSFGNSFLYITLSTGLENNVAVASTLASIAFIVALSWMYNYVRGIMNKMDKNIPYVAAYQFIAKGYADAIAGKLTRLVLKNAQK